MKHRKTRLWAVVHESICGNVWLSVGMFLSVLGAVVTGILPPLILERIVNGLTGEGILSGSLIALYMILLAVAGIFDAGKEGLITIFGQKVTHGLRSQLCKKLTRLPAAYYTDHETGIITSRFVNDVDTIETLFDSGIISMIADGCKVISILVVIFVKNKGLGCLMLLVTPLLMGLTLFVQKRMLLAQMDNRVAVGRANNHIPETIQNIRMIHTFRIEDYMKKKYGTYIQEGYQAMDRSNYYDAFYSPVIITVRAVLIAGMMICASGASEVQALFGMSAGTAVAVINYVGKVFNPLESIGMEIQNIQSALAGIARIDEFLQETERTMPQGQVQPRTEADPIAFEQVSFGYSRDQEILHKQSFLIHQKENVTLTGRTGAGKSTIFKLILGLYDPWEGEIKICGAPAAGLTDEKRAELIGYVEQSFHPVSGSIRDQVTLKKKTITDGQIWRALDLTGLSIRIRELEQGLDTTYSETLFSQGQIQLLSIARAIVCNPSILLLDEITANLDSMTEQMVLHALEQASVNRTVLSISHRQLKADGAQRTRILSISAGAKSLNKRNITE